MIIIEAAYQPSVQQIAFYVEETGECGEQRLHHCDGQAEKFYRDLEQTGVSVRMGMETTGYSRWFKRLLTEFGLRVWIGDAARTESRQGRYGAQTSHSAVLDVQERTKPATELHRADCECMRSAMKEIAKAAKPVLPAGWVLALAIALG